MVKSKSKRGTTRSQSSSNYAWGSQKSRSKLLQVHSAFSYLWCVDCIKPKTTDPKFEDVQSLTLKDIHYKLSSTCFQS